MCPNPYANLNPSSLNLNLRGSLQNSCLGIQNARPERIGAAFKICSSHPSLLHILNFFEVLKIAKLFYNPWLAYNAPFA